MASTERLSAATEAWVLMGDLVHSGKKRMHATAAEFDLSTPQLIALRQLQPGAATPMRELAQKLFCDNSNVTGIVDRLESRGLVERRPADHDRRVKLVSLTDAGAGVRESVNAAIDRAPSCLQGLAAEDQEALRDILRRALG